MKKLRFQNFISFHLNLNSTHTPNPKQFTNSNLKVGNESRSNSRRSKFFQFCAILFEKSYLKFLKSKIYKLYTVRKQTQRVQFLRHICKIPSTSQSNFSLKLLLHLVERQNKYGNSVNFEKSHIFIGVEKFMIFSWLKV